MTHPPELKRRLQDALQRSGAPSSDFDLNAAGSVAPRRPLRDAAVLIGVHRSFGSDSILLTKRSSALVHHPGQVAFPGGKRDAADESLEDTALREAEEEIGLARHHVEVMGRLPCHETVTGFRVTPVVGWVEGKPDLRVDPSEVAEVFSAPVSHVLDPDNFSVEGRIWRGARRKYYTNPYGPYYIWGATARILRALAERLSA